MSRRTLLAGGATLAATSVVLAGCGSDEPIELPTGEVIANVSDIDESGVLAAKLSTGLEVLVSKVAGDVVVMSAICPHQGCTVVDDGDELICPCHRSRFARTDGELIKGPAQSSLPHLPVSVAPDGTISVG